MYSKCISCDYLGNQCAGPNFLAMNPPGVIEWCRQRKKFLGMTNERLAELSDTPKGTVDRLLSGNYADYKYSTIRPIVRALIGENWGEHPCPSPDTLQAELESLSARYDRVSEKLALAESRHKAEMDQLRSDYQAKVDYLKDQVAVRHEQIVSQREQIVSHEEQFKAERRLRNILIAIVLVFLLVIIAALVVDALHPDLGYFWRAASQLMGNLDHSGVSSLAPL